MLWILALVGCVTEETGGEALGPLSFAGDDGHYSFEARFQPDPPEVGEVTVDVTVFDHDDLEVEPALVVLASMGAHGHDDVAGVPVDDNARHGEHEETEATEGTEALSGPGAFTLDLDMSGTWTLSVEVTGPGEADHGHVDFDVR